MESTSFDGQDQVLALFDVLGFSERVKQKGLPEIYSEYEFLLDFVERKDGSLCIGRAEGEDGSSVPAVGWLATEQTFFSDTILLWSPFDTFRFPTFCSLCASLVCEALSIRMPLRGAIAVGEAVLDKTKGIYLGSAVVEAADVEKAQTWLGVSFSPSAATRIRGFDPRLVLPFRQHAKEGAEDLIQGPVLDWPRMWRERNTEDLVSLLESLQQEFGPHPYIELAIEFACYSRDQHDWYLKRANMGPPE